MSALPSFHLAAICPKCHLVFPSGFVIGSVKNLTLIDNKSRCPRCGAWGRVPSGVYNTLSGLLEMTPLEHVRLEDLRGIAEDLKPAADGALSEPAMLEVLDRALPGASSEAKRQGWSRSEIIALITLLLTLIQTYLSAGHG